MCKCICNNNPRSYKALLYLWPVLKYLASKVAVAQDNKWSVLYLVKAPYHNCFTMIPV